MMMRFLLIVPVAALSIPAFSGCDPDSDRDAMRDGAIEAEDELVEEVEAEESPVGTRDGAPDALVEASEPEEPEEFQTGCVTRTTDNTFPTTAGTAGVKSASRACTFDLDDYTELQSCGCNLEDGAAANVHLIDVYASSGSTCTCKWYDNGNTTSTYDRQVKVVCCEP